MNNRSGRHSFNLVFTILLLGIFALAAIFVAVLGAKVYANSAEKLQDNFDTRTSLVYLTEKVRTAGGGSVEVIALDGTGDTALVIPQEIDGTVYESWIYIYEGELCESVIAQGSQMLPAAGQKIMPLKSFMAAADEDGVTILVETASGRTADAFVGRRTDA
ncbi:MAG: DUF4860 domain-containing protein [Clostridiales Family XIII bacterium]|jgi:hypothetical protein|nr:DUF4860 domain-containing protein [Clostridiales Family XIII bacterium]